MNEKKPIIKTTEMYGKVIVYVNDGDNEPSDKDKDKENT